MADTKTVTIEDLDARQTFSTLADCGPVLAEYQKVAGDGVEFVVLGADPETGDVDQGLYDPESMRTMLFRRTKSVKITEGEDKGKSKKVTVMVCVAPYPRVDVLAGDESGLAYLEHLFETEAQHRISRPFRELENNFAAVAAEAPHTQAMFIEGTKKDSAGGMLAAYNAFFTVNNAQFKKGVEAYNRSKITKAELRQALSCTGFANYRYTHLEEKGFFVKMLNYFILWAAKEGENPTIAKNWLASRDAATFTEPTADSLASEMDDMLAAFGDEEGAGAEVIAEATEATEADEAPVA